MINHKGYIGVLKVDADAGVIRGHVVNTQDTITFQGKSVDEAMIEFKASVDDYLAFCESLGRSPEKPFSGKFMVRLKPQIHCALTALARSKGMSVNKLVVGELTRLARRNDRSKPAEPATQNLPA